MVAGTALVASLLTTLTPSAISGQVGDSDRWVTTWATAVVARPSQPADLLPKPLLNFSDQTLRQIVHTSGGGQSVRVVFTNEFGTMPLVIGEVHIALRTAESEIDTTSSRALTFGGRTTATIPAGAVVISDPARLTVPAQSDLAIDLYLPGDAAATTSPLTVHAMALQTSYASTRGNYVGVAAFPSVAPFSSWFFLSRVEVAAHEEVGAVVAIGDSITDGSGSMPDANGRWTDHLARRLMETGMSVLNAGIAANFLFRDVLGPNVLARFDRDVIVPTGVTHVVVSAGINDIGSGDGSLAPTTEDVIAAYNQLIVRAHAHGLRVLGVTVTPFRGSTLLSWTPDSEQKRQAINQWIRASGAYDGVIDFDEVLRDKGDPTRLDPSFASEDGVHPNDAGYEAMASAVDLDLLRFEPGP